MSDRHFVREPESLFMAGWTAESGDVSAYEAILRNEVYSKPPARQVGGTSEQPTCSGRHYGGNSHLPAMTLVDFDASARDAEVPEPRTSDRFHSWSDRMSPQPGRVYELNRLTHRTGDHRTADAVVYVPPGFDPRKPVRVIVYNHGFNTDAPEAFRNSELQSQMLDADPNTMLIVPEWQTKTQSRQSSVKDKFHQPGFFRGMLQEILDKTPETRGLRVDDIDSFGIVTHSAGYRAARSQIHNNGLADKVTSVTVLDSLYEPHTFDKWIQDNIRDLASGRKQVQVFFAGSTSDNTQALARRVEDMLRRAGLSPSHVARDFRNGSQVMDSGTLAREGIVFKRSSVNIMGRGVHNSVTNVYLGRVLESERIRRGYSQF